LGPLNEPLRPRNEPLRVSRVALWGDALRRTRPPCKAPGIHFPLMTLESFIARWTASGDAERANRANKDSFLNGLCDVLQVERPQPKTGDPARDLYVFEKDVLRTRDVSSSVQQVDSEGVWSMDAVPEG
jgi:hypothetical protein